MMRNVVHHQSRFLLNQQSINPLFPAITIVMPKSLRLMPVNLLLAFFCFIAASGLAQTAFLDFNTVGQYTNNFNPWYDNGGGNGGNYSYEENTTNGVGGSGGVA